MSAFTPFRQMILLGALLTGIHASLPAAEKPIGLKLAAGWGEFGHGYAKPTALKVGDLVTVSGMIKGPTNRQSQTVLTTLPNGMRPTGHLMFHLNGHTGTARIDVTPDGRVLWINGPAIEWVSLEGIQFATTRGSNLTLGPGWHYVSWARPAVTKVGDTVLVSGLLQSGRSKHLATLPAGMRPSQSIVFNLSDGGSTVAVRVKPDGKIEWAAGRWAAGMQMHLTGISFSTAATESLPLGAGWANYGSGHAPATLEAGDDLVRLSGLVKGSQWGTVARLPAGSCPSSRLIFNLNNHQGSARVDVFPDCRVDWVAGSKNKTWLSLDGITFRRGNRAIARKVKTGGDLIYDGPPTRTHALPLVKGWRNYQNGYRLATVATTEDLVTVSGMIKGNAGRKPGTVLAVLPKGMRPAKRLIFNLSGHEATSRVDVLPDGRITWESGPAYEWVSLDGIHFTTGRSAALSLSGGWKNFGTPYAPASVSKVGNTVVVQGLIRGNRWGHITTLPAAWRPSKALVFNVNHHDQVSRVDVLANGQIKWVAGGKQHGWISLTGITFSLDQGTPLKLASGWKNYGAQQMPATVSTLGDRITLSGLIRGNQWATVATLPEGACPSKRLIFNLSQNERTMRVDVLADCRVHWVAGGKNHGWISLDGISFTRKGTTKTASASIPKTGGAGDTKGQGETTPSDSQGLVASLIEAFKNDLKNVSSKSKPFADVSIDFPDDWLDKLDGWKPKTTTVGGDKLETIDKQFCVSQQCFTVFLYRHTPKGKAAKKPQLAAITNQAALDNVIGEVAGTPLGALKVNDPAFIYVSLPKSKKEETYPERAFPPAVWTTIEKTYVGFNESLGPTVLLYPGFNLWSQVANTDTSDVTKLLREVGGDIGTVRVHGAVGKRETRASKGNGTVKETANYVQLARKGDWHPFGVPEVTVVEPTIEYEQWGRNNARGKRTRFWGVGSVELDNGQTRKAFAFAQRTRDLGDRQTGRKANPKGTTLVINAPSLTFKDLYALVEAYANHGGEVLKEGFKKLQGETFEVVDDGTISRFKTVVSTTRNVLSKPLEAIKVKPRNPYVHIPELEKHGKPLIAMATPREVLPEALTREGLPETGQFFSVNGNATVFGKAGLGLEALIARDGISASVDLGDLPTWGVVDLGTFSFELEPASAGSKLQLSGAAKMLGFDIPKLKIPVTNSGFEFEVASHCPAQPTMKASAPGHRIGSGSGFGGIDIDWEECIGEVLAEVLDNAKKAAGVVTHFAGDRLDDAVFGPGKKVVDWMKDRGVDEAVVDAFDEADKVARNVREAVGDCVGDIVGCLSALEFDTEKMWARLRALLPIRAAEAHHVAYKRGTPGTECEEIGVNHGFLWNGLCPLNHARDYKRVAASSRLSSDWGADRAVDGTRVGRNSPKAKEAFLANGIFQSVNESIPWWEVELKQRAWVDEIVIMGLYWTAKPTSADGPEAAIIALSDSVSGEALMRDTSSKVKRFAAKPGNAVSIKVGGMNVRHVRIYLPRAGGAEQVSLGLREVAVLGTPDPTQFVSGGAGDHFVEKKGANASGGITTSPGGDIYITTDGMTQVKRWGGSAWQKYASSPNASAPLTHIAAGKSWLWAIDAGSKIWRTPTTGTPRWTQVPGNAFDIDVGGPSGDDVYVTAPHANTIGKWNEGKGSWDLFSTGSYRRIAVDGKGHVWATKGDQTIWLHDGRWKKVSGKATDIAVHRATGRVYISDSRSKPQEYDHGKKTWKPMPASGIAGITTDAKARPWVIGRSGKVFAWEPK